MQVEPVTETKKDVEISKVASVNIAEKIYGDMVRNISFIIKGVETSQPRLIQKAIRQNVSARKNATKMVMLKIISHYIPINCVTYKFMNDGMSKLPDPISPGISNDENKMDIEVPALVEDVSSPLPTQTLPEVEIYVYTMVIVILLREKLFTDAAYHSNFLIDRIKSFNRRSLDLLSSKAYFYFSLAYEKIEKLENIRSVLLNLYRTTCIRHDDMGQAILLNLILRNYLHYNLVNQAHTFSLRTSFPENASNNQLCRYLYYMGHIQAIQLEYSEAYQRLMLASRKVPQESAPGFSILVNKLAILVQLLMGEIPEKRIFNQSDFRIPLQPYLALTQAVRDGDLQEFNNVVKKFEGSFKVDKHRTLVSRLGHNVLKTGLRKISLSYSRISLSDIAEKLHLSSASSAEFICAKAIRDGVIEASIDHDNGWLISTEILDVYHTEEPQNAFHKRIAFCLDVYNEAVRSMRYPPDAYKKELQRHTGNKSKSSDEEKSIEDLIKEMEDDLDE